jgi:hypothetical protein
MVGGTKDEMGSYLAPDNKVWGRTLTEEKRASCWGFMKACWLRCMPLSRKHRGRRRKSSPLPG